MENKNKMLGYLCDYGGGKEIKDWVAREDLFSDDQEKKDLARGWIVGLAEPWSASAEFYDVKRNCASLNKKVPVSEAWKATYTSIFYDCMESVIVAYGATPTEALSNVEIVLEEMMEIYETKYADCEDGERDDLE